MSSKLYLVTRRDLRHGSQAAQLVHGMATFSSDYPETFRNWERSSNTVVCLATENEDELYKLWMRAEAISNDSKDGLAVSIFREPDFDNQLTCVVLEPVDIFADLCSDLRLACS